MQKQVLKETMQAMKHYHIQEERTIKWLLEEIDGIPPMDGVQLPNAEKNTVKVAVVSMHTIQSNGLNLSAEYYTQSSQNQQIRAAIMRCHTLSEMIARIGKMLETKSISTRTGGKINNFMLNPSSVKALTAIYNEFITAGFIPACDEQKRNDYACQRRISQVL